MSGGIRMSFQLYPNLTCRLRTRNPMDCSQGFSAREQMRQKWATTTGQITLKDNLLRVVQRQFIQDET